MGLLDTLGQILAAAQQNQGHTVKDEHIDQVAETAPKDVLGNVLSDTFRSKETPPMGDLVGQMFGKSNGQQQAGLLNQIIASIGPAAAAAIAGGVLSKVMSPGSSQITPEQASKLSPSDVTAVVNAAEQSKPELADQLGKFYAEHSTLIKTVGAAAALYALKKMRDNMTNKS